MEDFQSLIIDRFECGKCPFTSLYCRSHTDEAMTQCPKCGNKAIYLKVEMGYIYDKDLKS